MRNPALKRNASAIALFAALATWGASADAATISVRTTVSPTGPGSTAQMVIYDADTTPEVSAFAFKVYYKKSQATLTTATGTIITGSEVAIYDNTEYPVEAGSSWATAGFTHYKIVDGFTSLPWENVGDLANLEFTLATDNVSGKVDVAVGPYPQDDLSDPRDNWYLDGDVSAVTGIVYAPAAAVYSDAQVAASDYDGIYAGHGDLQVTLAGNSFYGGAPGEPTSVAYLNGTALATTFVSSTEIKALIPASLLATVSGNYQDLPLAVSNDGTDIAAESNIPFTIVSRDVVYTDDDFAATAQNKRAAAGKIKGSNAFDNISGGVANVNAGGTANVAAGNYVEKVVVGKTLTLKAEAGAKVQVPNSGSRQMVVHITAPNVTVDGLDVTVNQPHAGAGIVAANAENVVLKNNIVRVTGNNPFNPGFDVPSFSSTRPTGIAALSGVSGRKATIQDNTVIGAASINSWLWRGIWTQSTSGEITGNEVGAGSQDIQLSFPSKFPTLVQGNTLRGAGIEVTEPNGGGQVDITQNIFNHEVAPDQSIIVKHHTANNTYVNIFENTFNVAKVGVHSAGSRNVNVTNNTFNVDTAKVGSAGYVHVLVDTGGHTASSGLLPSSIAVTANTFNGSTNNGTAIQVKNGKKGQQTPADFGTIQVGGLATDADPMLAANTFAADLQNVVKLDAANNKEALVDIFMPYNVYGAGTGSKAFADLSLNELFTLEDKIYHALDNTKVGVVRVTSGTLYVTQNSGKIQRGVDAATAGDTIHVQAGSYAESTGSGSSVAGLSVNKAVTLLGPNADKAGIATDRASEAIIRPGVALNATALLRASETRQYNWRPLVDISASDVSMKGFTVTGENPALASQSLDFAGMQLAAGTGINSEADNVVIQNNIVDKFSFIGLWATGWFGLENISNVTVSDNLVTNVHSNEGAGFGYYVQGTSGRIENNHANNVRIGMQVQPYDNQDAGSICQNNVLNAWKLGLWYNYTVNGASAWEISGNTITGAALPANFTPGAFDLNRWVGFETTTHVATANGGLISGNTINGAAAPNPESFGFRVLSNVNDMTDNLVIAGNTVSNVKTGVFAGIDGSVASTGKLNLHNNQITNTQIAVNVSGPNNTSHDITGNTLAGNAIHLALATDATVNTHGINGIAAGNLEAIVNANTVTGKTYISAGMADAQGAAVAEAGFVNVRSTINGSIEAPANAAVNNTVKVMAGLYPETLTLDIGKPVRLSGSGADSTTIVGSHTGPDRRTVYIRSASIVEGFTLTRDGNNPADWVANKLSETVTIGSGANNAIVQNNKIVDGRSGVYVENTGTGNIVRNNLITHNHTGVHIVNGVHDLTFEQNRIVDNRTAGILFRGGGSGIKVRSNVIMDNWLGQIIHRYEPSDVVDASGNWFGTTNITTNVAELPAEPGYNVHIPSYYGGTAVAPGNARMIAGAAVDKIDYNAALATGDEKPGASISDLAFEGDFSTLYINAASPLAGGEVSHITDAVKLIADGALSGAARQILATDGIYVNGPALVNKPVIIDSENEDRGLVTFQPRTAGQTGIEIASSDVTLQNITVSGTGTTNFGTAILRNSGVYNNTILNKIAVANAGISPGSGAPAGAHAVVLGQPAASAVNSTGNQVMDSTFNNLAYTGLALLGGETVVSNNQFTNITYQGIYAAPDGSTAGTAPVAVVKNNQFTNLAAGVRMVGAAAGSIVGGTPADANTFTLGQAVPGYGVSVEYSPVPVQGNTFKLGDVTASPPGLGDVHSLGVYVWGTQADVSGNSFTGIGAGPNPAFGVLAIGERTGPLAGIGDNTSNKTDVTVSANSFAGLKSAVVATNADAAGKAVKLTVTGNETIDNNGNGVVVDGAFVTATVNNNNFDGNTRGIEIANAAAASVFTNNTFAALTGTAKYVVNTSGNDYDVSSNTFAGVKPATATVPAEFWTIQGGLVDALDKAGNGHLQLASGTVFVPAAKHGAVDGHGLIARAGLAAQDGDFIALQGGAYSDGAAKFDKHVVLLTPTAIPASTDPGSLDTGAATISHPVTFELGSSSNAAIAAGLKFTGNGSVTFSDLEAPAYGTAFYAVGESEFNGVAGTAITVDRVASTAGAVQGSVTRNTIANGGAGILVRNSTNLLISENTLTSTFGTGIEITKAKIPGGGAIEHGIIAEGIEIDKNVIIGSGRPGTGTDDTEKGLTADTPGTVENGNAYGIFVGRSGGATGPSVASLKITGNTIAENAATGVALWNADGGTGADVVIVRNTIEENGIWRKGEPYAIFAQNTDGVKLKHSKNVEVAQNFIRKNQRNNVLVEGNVADTGKGVKINFNHLEANVPVVQNAGEAGTVGGGLMLQITSPEAATTTVDAEDNWWGHVFGPNYAANATGRGSKIELKGGLVSAENWYGKRTPAQKWYALNDRDGDGIVDADEDLDLTGTTDANGLWGAETGLTNRDSDGDGYEDGVEVALGSDPLDANSTPMNRNGYLGNTGAHLMAAYANSMADTDGDGYLDFYEIAMGTDPTDAASKPALGLVLHQQSMGANQVAALRRLLVGAMQFTDAPVEQDNADVNRDGVVNNADLVFLRRFLLESEPTRFPVVMPAP